MKAKLSTGKNSSKLAEDINHVQELFNLFTRLGCYVGTIECCLTVQCAFEGFYGKASETWESQYTWTSPEVKTDSGTVLIPEIKCIKSYQYETLDIFCKRILNYIENNSLFSKEN